MAGASSNAPRRKATSEEFIEMSKSEEFAELKSRFRGFTFPAIIIALLWFFAYLVVATFFPDFMAVKIGGGFNIGLVLGIAQFVTTFLITWLYVKFANKNLEPRQAAIREKMEG